MLGVGESLSLLFGQKFRILFLEAKAHVILLRLAVLLRESQAKEAHGILLLHHSVTLDVEVLRRLEQATVQSGLIADALHVCDDRSALYKLRDLRLQFNFVDYCFECVRLRVGKTSHNLAVQFYVRMVVESVDEPRVSNSMFSDTSVDALDPVSANSAFLDPSVTVSVLLRLVDFAQS